MRPRGATLGSMALQNTAEYSNDMPAPTSAARTSIHISPGCMAGTANQIVTMHGAPSSTQARSQGFRRPPASAMAPRMGAPMATRNADVAVIPLQSSCPRTESGTTTVAK